MLEALQRWRKRPGALPLGLLMGTAVVLLCAYSIYSIWLSVEPFAGQTVNLAGRQRLLSQQIANETLLLIQEPTVERRIQSRQRTYVNLARFRRVQEGLARGDKGLDLAGEIPAAARAALERMAPYTVLLIGNVEAVYGLSPHDLMRLSNVSPEVRGILQASEVLIVQYDDFLREYIAQAEQKVVRHKALEIVAFIAAFLLILLAQFVTSGLGRQIQGYRARLWDKQRLLKREILALRRSEEERRLMAAVFEQSNESIVITDASGTVRFANPSYLRNTGYALAEILGQNQRVLKSGKQDAEFYRQLWGTISTGLPWRGQMVNRSKDGTLRTEAEAIYPIRDHRGRISHYAGIKHDVSRELELEKQLREAQKLEAMGVLAGGVAHDFNNILTPIIGFTTLTLDLVPRHGEAAENLANILVAANRAKDLVTQIRNTVRQSEDPPEAVRLQSVAREVLKLVRSTASQPIGISEHLPAELPAVRAHPSDVHRLLMNLCVNACYAMPEGGQLGVTLGLAELTETAGYLGEPAPGTFVRIEVQDTGHGMSEETRAHIFEPYFTTRAAGTGTGFGLFLVFNIVKQLKGGIRVASRERVGTTFEVILPVSPSDLESASAAAVHDSAGA